MYHLGRERANMELAVSLSLFASRVDEMSTTLRDDREGVEKALNSVT